MIEVFNDKHLKSPQRNKSTFSDNALFQIGGGDSRTRGVVSASNSQEWDSRAHPELYQGTTDLVFDQWDSFLFIP